MRRPFTWLSAMSLLTFVAAVLSLAVIEQVNSAHARRRNASIAALSERWYAIERDVRAVEQTTRPGGGFDLKQRDALTAERKRVEDAQARLIASTPQQRIVTSAPKRVAAFAWILPACWLVAWGVRRIRPARPLPAGVCATCGYDLRATPTRCPECGTAAGGARPTS